MVDIAHKNITGADLHEPKGVAAASANRVYVSDGNGSGAWSQVPAAALTSAANPFGAQLLFVQHELPSGSSGENYSSGSWHTQPINTIKVNQIGGASLTNNTITLPTGTYFFWAITAPGNGTGEYKARLRNTTNSSTLATGQRGVGFVVGSVSGWEYGYPMPFNGVFTLSVQSDVQLQHYRTSSFAISSSITGVTDPNVYRTMAIWKIA